MVVTRRNFKKILRKLRTPEIYGLDTETYGLGPNQRLFSIIISSCEADYYFNFHPYIALDENMVLPKEWIKEFEPVLYNQESVFKVHNAKADMHWIFNDGIDPTKMVIHCSKALEKVLQNNYFGVHGGHKPYALGALAYRRGMAKDDKVEEYIQKNKLYTMETMPGKKKKFKNKHFEKVPFEIMSHYGEMDGKLHRAIGIMQEQELADLEIENEKKGYRSIMGVVENERQLTMTTWKMERCGVLVGKGYCEAAQSWETDQIEEAKEVFQGETGETYKDSNVLFSKVFDSFGIKYPTTEKGNPSFNKEALKTVDHPIANLIKEVRKHEKYRDYYSGFLHYMDDENILRANINQDGADTGRMSMSDPSLHNVPKEDDDHHKDLPFWVRGAIVPRPGKYLGMFDYDQQEYRFMADYAGETELIRKILDQGLDVHQATAELMDVSRKHAKTLNFGLLYGMGAQKLANALGVSVDDAKSMKRLYFEKLPKIGDLRGRISDVGKYRGYIFNWFGRRCYIDSPDFAYKLPNHWDQGGCADIMKIAMNRIDRFFTECGCKSRMVIQVHDELVFEIEPGEEDIVAHAKDIMESVYTPKNGLPLTVGMDHSFVSWAYHTKKEGLPTSKDLSTLT